MSLLKEIQDAAIDSKVDIAVLLRKCKVLAAKLGNEEFKQWVDNELNGYKSKEELADYRVLSIQAFGHFTGPYGSSLPNAPIPPSRVPKEFREWATTVYATQPISSYEASVIKEKGVDPISNWPADLIADVGAKIYQNMNCLRAWQVIPRSVLVALLDTVRNRILSFVLEIESEAPDAGESPTGVKSLSEKQVGQVFNTFIMGDVGNLATGSSDFSQSSQVQVLHGDLDSLLKHLSSKGISEKDLATLEVAIKDEPRCDEKKFGEKVSGWLGKMISKAASGTWNITINVAAEVLRKAISTYYGF